MRIESIMKGMCLGYSTVALILVVLEILHPTDIGFIIVSAIGQAIVVYIYHTLNRWEYEDLQ